MHLISGDDIICYNSSKLLRLRNSLIQTTMAAVHHPPNPPALHSFESVDLLVESLAAFVVKAQKEAIDKKGRFTIALSGGSLPKMLKGLINNPAVKWDLW